MGRALVAGFGCVAAFASVLAACVAASAQEAAPAPQQPAWATVCVAPSRSAAAACFLERQMALRITGNDTAPLAMSLRLDVAAPGQAPVMSIRLPFGLDLAAGVRVAVDAGPPGAVAFATCEPNGCVARTTLTPEQVEAMKAGLELKLAFSTSDGRTLSATIPLAGFTAAMTAIE